MRNRRRNPERPGKSDVHGDLKRGSNMGVSSTVTKGLRSRIEDNALYHNFVYQNHENK